VGGGVLRKGEEDTVEGEDEEGVDGGEEREGG
jgi:hypothetical protein